MSYLENSDQSVTVNKKNNADYARRIVNVISKFFRFLVLFSKQPEFQATYALGQPSIKKLILLNTVLFPSYYFSEEFFYRGFLFLGLWRRIKWHSFWVTDFIFAFAHLGKPGLEILLSMFASVVFNILTLSTKSIYPALITHWVVGCTFILLINA